MPEQGYKRCGGCRETKPFAAFNRNRSRRDGLQNYCRECHARSNRLWVERHPGRKTALVAAYNERDPTKLRAREAARKAVRSGGLTKPGRCEECGEPTKSGGLHGHHEDYSKPLDVEWLCRTCHEQRHS